MDLARLNFDIKRRNEKKKKEKCHQVNITINKQSEYSFLKNKF